MLVESPVELLLVQEAVAFDGVVPLPEGWSARPFEPFGGWGSVVAVRDDVTADLEWRPDHEVIEAFGSYLDFASVTVGGTEVAVVSVHSPPNWRDDLWRAVANDGPLPKGMARPWPSDVLLDALIQVLADRHAIVAGDWNEAPNYPGDADPGTKLWFDRARAAPWMEAIATVFKGPVTTNFTPNATRPYQNDHVFLTPALAAGLRSVGVWNEPAGTVSDHAGVVVTLGDLNSDA